MFDIRDLDAELDRESPRPATVAEALKRETVGSLSGCRSLPKTVWQYPAYLTIDFKTSRGHFFLSLDHQPSSLHALSERSVLACAAAFIQCRRRAPAPPSHGTLGAKLNQRTPALFASRAIADCISAALEAARRLERHNPLSYRFFEPTWRASAARTPDCRDRESSARRAALFLYLVDLGALVRPAARAVQMFHDGRGETSPNIATARAAAMLACALSEEPAPNGAELLLWQTISSQHQLGHPLSNDSLRGDMPSKARDWWLSARQAGEFPPSDLFARVTLQLVSSRATQVTRELPEHLRPLSATPA